MKTKQNFSVITLIIALIIVSCNVVGERGNGNVIRQERKVSAFNELEISGAFNVFLTQGPTQLVIVEADDNLMDDIKTEVFGTTLKIEPRHPIHNAKSLKIFITVPVLKHIDVSGAVDIETQTKFKQDDLSIEISGATDAKLELELKKLDIRSSGGCDMKLAGIATVLALDCSGAVDFKGFDLLCEEASIEISGAGNAQVNVSKTLKSNVSGAADVRYKGNPEKVWSDVSGAGSIKKVD